MRSQELIEHVTVSIQESFDDDVAEAFLSDDETLKNLARHLNRNYGYNQIAATIQQVADDLDDDTADWLVDRADNPAAWLYGQV